MDLSIIIISFNTKTLLRECLQAVYRTVKDISFEVIVVDNASRDGSIDMVRNEFADVQVIVNEKNLGFAKANNQALTISKGEFVLLLNSDAFLQENTVEILIGRLRNHPGAFAAGPKVVFPDGRLQSKGEHFPCIGKSFLNLTRVSRLLSPRALYVLFPKYFWPEDSTRPVDWLSGCCLMARHEAFARVGLLSEKFFFYGEEIEWCYRAKKCGYEIWYISYASVIHCGESSFLEERFKWYQRSMAMFYKETGSVFVGLVITMNAIILTVLRIIYLKFRGIKNVSSREHAVHYQKELYWHYELLKLLLKKI